MANLPDFRAVLDAVPGLCLILLPDDPVYTIIAANQAYALAAATGVKDLVGQGLLPDDNLLASLRKVVASKTRHAMPAQNGGGRYWAPSKYSASRQDW